jgi:diaminopimelate epimerase
MTVKFYKYQGTGNDFIMIDNRVYGLNKNQTDVVKRLCDRKFGIGADGLILLNEKIAYNFEMVYFNSDGNESTMCGNGGRCLVKFAHHLGLIESNCRFWAIDGAHEAHILNDGKVSLKMKDVEIIEHANSHYILKTGSPHYIIFVKSVKDTDVIGEAKKVRYSERFAKEGINVNFVEKRDDGQILVRTYERGVEDETLSCGTGVVASSLALASLNGSDLQSVKVQTPGGELEVKFEHSNQGFTNIYLIGPAEKVFVGEIEI